MQDREAVQKNGAQPTAAVGVTLEKNSGRHEIALRLAPDAQQKKQLFIDRKKAARMSDLMGMLQCVIFSPEDLMLVKDGPPLRRRLMDMTASQLSTACFTALQGYRKALEQRNAMLRDAKYGPPPDPAIMDVFEKTMADCSGVIIRERARLLQGLAGLAA